MLIDRWTDGHHQNRSITWSCLHMQQSSLEQ